LGEVGARNDRPCSTIEEGIMRSSKGGFALAIWLGVIFAACGRGGSSTYALSGAVTGAIADGVLITLTGATNATTTTAGGGSYSFSGLANGSYTLTPSKAGYSFSPPSITVTVGGGNVTGQNFLASLATFKGFCSTDNWCWQN